MKQHIAAVIFSLALAVITATAAYAGSLTPPGAPAPTMRTMDQLKPSWDQVLSSTDGGTDGCNSSRFKCVMNNEAVLDKETGLVWAKTSDATLRTWQAAMDYCDTLELGGRFGWRLPTIQELGTLIDKSNPGTPQLPVGHPFVTPWLSVYRSSTTYASNPDYAWYVDFGNGRFSQNLKSFSLSVRCVRGGQ